MMGFRGGLAKHVSRFFHRQTRGDQTLLSRGEAADSGAYTVALVWRGTGRTQRTAGYDYCGDFLVACIRWPKRKL